MATSDHSAQLARAWALHREHRNDAAIDELSQLLRDSPDQIDALYGLALSQRQAHLIEAAKQSFERCLSLVNRVLEQSPGEDRYEMLQRFIHQRLEEMGT